MYIGTEGLKILMQDGTPLQLEVSQAKTSPNDPNWFWVKAKDRGNFKIKASYDVNLLIRELRGILRFYPNEVRINGQTIDREPPPELAKVFITKYNGQEERSHSFRKYNLEDLESKEYQGYFPENTVAGGVLCYLPQHWEKEKISYWSEIPGPFRHRRALMKVQVMPMYILENQEMDAINSEDHDTATNNQETTAKAKARKTILEKANAQVERTMAHPNTPPAYNGLVYHYFLTQEGTATYFEKGAPIAVYGTPVTMCEAEETNAAKVAAAEALYRSDHPLVPVQGTTGLKTSKSVSEFRFEHTPCQQQQVAWCMEKVQDITLVIRVEDEEEQEVQADFTMTGESEYEKHVMFVPGRITHEALSECMVRGYFDELNYTSWEDVKDDVERMKMEFFDLALGVIEDPEEGLRRQLQRAADSFSSDLPAPTQTISVTSRNGKVVMTLRPS